MERGCPATQPWERDRGQGLLVSWLVPTIREGSGDVPKGQGAGSVCQAGVCGGLGSGRNSSGERWGPTSARGDGLFVMIKLLCGFSYQKQPKSSPWLHGNVGLTYIHTPSPFSTILQKQFKVTLRTSCYLGVGLVHKYHVARRDPLFTTALPTICKCHAH